MLPYDVGKTKVAGEERRQRKNGGVISRRLGKPRLRQRFSHGFRSPPSPAAQLPRGRRDRPGNEMYP